MGDMLVVALTSDENVNKGPDRPVNNWSQRAAVLKECRSVDLVIKSPNSVDAIRLMRPQIFVKGIDYADGGFTENIEEACKEVGAELKFTTSKKRSSTEILGKL
jgi:D-beta-D-heptose 7-phosphate kinase/D-beta-D-heptose 1-phosphate adenosyltransferase